MKTATLDRLYPVLKTFGGMRQGTLTFARACLRAKRRHDPRHRWRVWSFRHPVTGRMWHCLTHPKVVRVSFPSVRGTTRCPGCGAGVIPGYSCPCGHR